MTYCYQIAAVITAKPITHLGLMKSLSYPFHNFIFDKCTVSRKGFASNFHLPVNMMIQGSPLTARSSHIQPG